jgi:tRNA 2-thiouridine synthesizing protein A
MKADVSLDCFGLLCPMPVIKTAQLIKELKIGQVLEIVATDMGIKNDLPAWCRSTGQQYLGMEEKNGEYRAYIKKLVDIS